LERINGDERANRYERTSYGERANPQERTSFAERAKNRERTSFEERASMAERTITGERAINRERTTPDERHNPTTPTGNTMKKTSDQTQKPEEPATGTTQPMAAIDSYESMMTCNAKLMEEVYNDAKLTAAEKMRTFAVGVRNQVALSRDQAGRRAELFKYGMKANNEVKSLIFNPLTPA
jgi:hypothetical protein